MQSVPIQWSATSHSWLNTCVSAEISLAKSVSKLFIDKLIFIQFEKRNPVSTHLLEEWHTVLYLIMRERLKDRSQSHMCSVGVGSALHSGSHTFWSAHCCECLVGTRCTRVIVWVVKVVCGTLWFPRSSRLLSCYRRGKWVAQLGMLGHLSVVWAVRSEGVHLMLLALALLLRVEHRWWRLSLHLRCLCRHSWSSRFEGLHRRDFLSLKRVANLVIVVSLIGCTLSILAFIVMLVLIVFGHKSRSRLSVAEVRFACVAIELAISLRVPLVLLLWILFSLIVLVIKVIVLTILSLFLVEVLALAYLVLIVIVILLETRSSIPIIAIIRVTTVLVLLVRLRVLIAVLISLAKRVWLILIVRVALVLKVFVPSPIKILILSILLSTIIWNVFELRVLTHSSSLWIVIIFWPLRSLVLPSLRLLIVLFEIWVVIQAILLPFLEVLFSIYFPTIHLPQMLLLILTTSVIKLLLLLRSIDMTWLVQALPILLLLSIAILIVTCHLFRFSCLGASSLLQLFVIFLLLLLLQLSLLHRHFLFILPLEPFLIIQTLLHVSTFAMAMVMGLLLVKGGN